MAAANFIAGGNILPSTIVTQTGAGADFTVKAPNSSSVFPCGVVHDSVFYPPGLIGSTSPFYAAISGQEVKVFGEGDECLCMAGAAITVGNLIKSDSASLGIPIAAGDSTVGPVYYVGRSEESTSGAGILFRLTVQPGLFHT